MYSGKHPVLKPPLVMGHEFFGTVEEVGSGVPHGPALEHGALVTIVPPIGCGHCYNCLRELPYLCEQMVFVGGQLQGGLSELVPVPSDNLLEARSAGGNVAWSAQIRAGRPGAATATAAAERLLAVVGLEGAKDRGARELSGGEQQRLALVCALAGSPALLVANEPTASLDAESAHAVATALRTLVDTTSVTMLVATHDRHIVDVADVVVPLDHGRRVG